jgi:hypothetical protein
MRASERVFDIPELFEAVLIHLPAGELLVSAQRVTKKWFELLNTSSQLQQKLFLRQYPERNQDTVPTKNPLFKKICRFFLKRHVYAYIDEPSAGSTNSTTIIPRFAAYFALDPPRKEKVKIKQSWQRMYITDRPCGVYIFVESRGTIYNERRKMSLTMGEMMRMVYD